MNLAKSTFALLGAFSLSAAISQGQTTLSFSDIKSYIQTGPDDIDFEGGSWNLNLVDGSWTIAPCPGGFQIIDPETLELVFLDGNGGILFTPPSIPACPLGTTALITSGDINEDGLPDLNTYWSVATLVPARLVEPFRTDLISLEAAPPSALERPLDGSNFRDASISLFYDLVNTPQNLRRFDVTNYTFSRPYGPFELDDQYEEIVPGRYDFRFPRLGIDPETGLNPFQAITVTHIEMIEAAPGPGFVPVGNEWRLTNDGDWRNGVLELDPRVFFEFNWEGFNGNTTLQTDSTFFSLIDRETGLVVFPPYPTIINPNTGLEVITGANERFPQEIATPSTEFELGPFFFVPGERVTAQIDFRRNNFSTAISTDTSQRFFRWNIDFIDSYDGFRMGLFPDRTSDSLTGPEADFDGDGVSNLEEFALQTDPSDPASVSVPTPVLDPVTNQCIYEIIKRPDVGSKLVYQAEYTTNLVDYTLITDDDPNWAIVFDDENRFQVRTRFSSPPTTCLIRLRVSER